MLGIECLLLVPFILKFKKLEEAGRWVFAYLVSSIVFASGTTQISMIWGNNMWFFALMYMVQFVILSVFYATVIKSKIMRTAIWWMMLPVFIIFLLDLFRLEGILHYNSIFASARNFVLIVYGVIFFLQLLRDETLIKQSIFINTLPDFWFNAGFFIYLCSTMLKNLSYNYFSIHSISTTGYILSLSFVAGIIQLILIFIGLLKVKTTTNGYS
ncbi:hypothetical protein GA0116948_11385 [Chitinophaga costaii]|uniref:Uncharacterized protein n=1 Tax=Chitinophaga costaii TaxID=1335309 RepID=A0A1C4FEF2_9BACT|nr:hypothetical protein [Chitinophaga costaii]SCC53881.1 hypothetical protein GA0116948_11385 [Chitinophaga costaii]